MSLLVWPLPQSIGMWLEAKAAWPGPLETSLRLKADFPLDEGTQTDDDWDIGISSRIHSESRAFLISGFEARFELLYKICLGPLEIKPGAGFFYQYVNWQGWDGIQTVAGYEDSIEDYYYYNLIFTYEQKWFVPYARFAASVRTGRIEWLLGLNYSPYLFCEAIDLLCSYHWPGNVRELENVVERAVILSNDEVIHAWQLPPSLQSAESSGTRLTGQLDEQLARVERELIVEALKDARGHMAKAARALGVSERVMALRVKAFSLDYRLFRRP